MPKSLFSFLVFTLVLPISSLYYQSHIAFCVLHESSRPEQYLQKTIQALRAQSTDPILIVNITNLPQRERPACLNTLTISCLAQQISLDYAVALEHCARVADARWSVIIEDDVEACDHAVQEIEIALARLDPNVTMYARFSKFTLATAFPTERTPLS